MFRLTGRDPNQPAPNYIGQKLIYTDDSFDKLAQAAEACIQHATPYQLILELRDPAPNRRWMLAHGEAIIDERRKIVALRGTLQNKTELIEAQIALTQRIREAEELKQRARVYVQNASDGFHVLEADGTLVDASDSFFEMLGYRSEEILGQHISFWDAKFSMDALNTLVSDHMKTEKTKLFETLHRHKDDRLVEVEISCRPVQIGAKRLLINASRDISGRKAIERQLRLSAIVFNAANEAIAVTDKNNRFLQVNQAFERITGYSAEDVIGKNPSILSSGRQPKDFYQRMWTALVQEGRWSGEIWNRRKTGEFFPEWLSITRISNDLGETENHVAIFTDITEQKAAEEAIQQLAYHDPLTGLANRRMMLDRVQNEVDRCSRLDLRVAVLFIDLDYFKNVNDHHGHLIGDELLVCVAKRIKESVRRSDIVGRLGGDEFLVIMPDVRETDFAAVVAETILARLAAPFNIGGIEMSISASIGLAISPDDAGNVTELLKFADIAMYEAKQKGRNTYLYFSNGMNNHASRRMELSTALRSAILNDELRLAFQPQIDLASSRLVGMEALIRWTRSNGDVISPVEFIPIAEESGLIVRIGEWVIENACKQIRSWRDQGFNPPSVAINVSAIQIERSNVTTTIQSYLSAYKLMPDDIVIEITESVMMKFSGEIEEPLQKLASIGSDIAMDDFGTGYSSLSYLTHFKVAKLKVDRAFVRDITNSHGDRAIVGAVASMARQLGMKVIAEGVETAEQAALLLDLGVETGQGYFWSKPVWDSEMQSWLTKDTTLGLTSDDTDHFSLVTWNEEMRIGHPTIDADHMQLIEIINLVSTALRKNDLAGADNIKFSLLSYVASHFEREERLLASIGYTDLPSHKAKHQRFEEIVQKMNLALMTAGSEAEKLSIIAALNDMLKSWLVQHILVEDAKMIPFLQAAGFKREWDQHPL